MVTIMDKKQIIDYKLQGYSNREIERKLGFNRKTVAKYWKAYQDTQSKIKAETDERKRLELQDALTAPPKYDICSRTKKLMTPLFYEHLESIVKAEIEKEKLLKTKKQNLTKKQIHKLMQEFGHKVGYSTLCIELDKVRNRTKECFIKQVYYYGERLEYDFGEVVLYINGSPHKVFLACLSSPASNLRWCFMYENQKQEVFLDSHVRFFEMAGGVWNEVVYDNMRNVVKKFLGKNEKELNEELVKLATYYGFKINVTNAFSGNEKGHVENTVKTLRNWIFAERVIFDSVEDAERYMNQRLVDINKKSTIASELSVLKPVPPKYEIARITSSKVDKEGFIQVECNKYSVPDYLVGFRVTTKIYYNKVIIYSNDEFVCEHKRLKGKGQCSANIKHFLNTLLKKPGAVEHSEALRSNPKLNEIFCKYYLESPKQFVEIIDEYKHASWNIIFEHLIKKATEQSLKSRMTCIKTNIPKPNTLVLKTQAMLSKYDKLAIGG